MDITEKPELLLKNIALDYINMEFYKLAGEPVEHSADPTMTGFGTKAVNFTTTDPQLAPRIVAAIKHAAKLCGAQRDVF
jgi:hypothetical protein